MVDITREYMYENINDRTFAMRVADLAVELARQAGEAVTRPLTKAQLDRALDVNRDETNFVLKCLFERYELAHKDGQLPDYAYGQKVDPVP